MTETIKLCLTCHGRVVGRTDKKFCCTTCRVRYHNLNRGSAPTYIRKVNYILNRNRRILQETAVHASTSVSKELLKKKGFNFDYHTALEYVGENEVRYFCYDYGYEIVNNNRFNLLKRKESD